MINIKTKIITLITIVLLTTLLATMQDVTMLQAYDSNYWDKGSTPSTATLEDNFCESTVLVVLSREASHLGEFSVNDFPELSLSEVRCITPGINQARMKGNNPRRILELILNEPSKENVLSAVKILEQRQDIGSAEPNFYEEIRTKQSIPERTTLTPLNTGILWAQNAIRVSEAQGITTGCSSIVVGVIDTGIQSTIEEPHMSLNHLLIRELGLGLGGSNPHIDGHPDFHGHGTLSAGLISSPRTGVAQNVRLVSIRMTAIQSSQIVDSINHAIEHRIPILTMSMGSEDGFPDGGILNAAIDDWGIDHNGLFICSAGNHSRDNDMRPRFPASLVLPNLITVGASDHNSRRSVWRATQSSNIGARTVDVFAPGGSEHGPNIRSTSTSGGYYNGYLGTSAAAPQVAGVAALMLSINPSLLASEIRDIIINTVTPVSWETCSFINNHSVAGGIVNAYHAVRAARDADTTLRFDIISGTNNVSVSTRHHAVLTGDIVIPETVVIAGSTRRVTEIATNGFANQSFISNIVIPCCINHIRDFAFENSGLISIILAPNSNLNSIGYGAFRYNRNLTSIHLPRSLRTINDRAFEGCINLQSVTFEANSDLRIIGNNSFRDCWSLREFEMPNMVSEIGHDAFQHANLREVTIPASVNFIGDRAFRNNPNLRTVTILRPSDIPFNGTVAGGSLIFDRGDHTLSIQLPDERSLLAYSHAPGWRNHSDRMWSNIEQIHLELNHTRNINSDLILGSREFVFFNDTPRFVRIVLSGGVIPWERSIVVRNAWGPMEVLDGMGMAETSMFSTEVTVFLPHIGNFFIDTQHLSGPGQIFLRIEEVQRHVVDFSPSAPLRLNIFRGGYGSEMHRVILNQNARFNVSIPHTPGLIFIIYRFDGNGFDFSNSHWFFNGGNGTVTLPAGTYYMGYFQGPRGWSAGSINITRVDVPLMFSLDVDTAISNHNAITEEDFEILRMILNKDLREQEYLPFQQAQ